MFDGSWFCCCGIVLRCDAPKLIISPCRKEEAERERRDRSEEDKQKKKEQKEERKEARQKERNNEQKGQIAMAKRANILFS